MIRLRNVTVLAAVLATAASGLSVSSAAAADQAAPCDPSLPAGLKWSVPSSLAWGRDVRIGANVVDGVQGPAYEEDSVGLSVDAGSAHASSDPISHDLEFVVTAPDSGTAIAASAAWKLTDDARTTHCVQTAAMSIPTAFGRILRYSVAGAGNGITWRPIGAGDCHDAALEPISLTLRQGGVTRQMRAPDQCAPAGTRHVRTHDWELSIGGGAFRLAALRPHSSLRTRMRYVLRVGSRRVASGSLALVRDYHPQRTIGQHDPDFWPICVRNDAALPVQVVHTGTSNACRVAGSFKVSLTLA